MCSKKKIVINAPKKNTKSKLYAEKKSKKKVYSEDNEEVNEEVNLDNESEGEIVDKLTKLNLFDQPMKRKVTPKLPKMKDVQIDMENDTQEEIIKKLVDLLQITRHEFADYRTHVEGTYCTSTELNRLHDNVEKIDGRVYDLEKQVEDITK